jgi:hypothetical protein
VGGNKTQIVYSCNLNFHSVVPYLDLLISNALMERVEGTIARYRITAKGEAALGHMRELEKMMPEGEGEMKLNPYVRLDTHELWKLAGIIGIFISKSDEKHIDIYS